MKSLIRRIQEAGRRVDQAIRSRLMDVTCVGMNWCSDHFHGHGCDEITWRNHVGWFLEDQLSCAFDWVYAGSDREVEHITSGEFDYLPDRFLSPRQLEVRRRLCEWVDIEVED